MEKIIRVICIFFVSMIIICALAVSVCFLFVISSEIYACNRYKFDGLTTIKTEEQANEYFPKYAEYIECLLDEKEIEYEIKNSITEPYYNSTILFVWKFIFNDGYISIGIYFDEKDSTNECSVDIGLLCSDVEKEQSKIKEHLLMFYNIIEFTNGNEQRFGDFQDYENSLNNLFQEYNEKGYAHWEFRPYNIAMLTDWIQIDLIIGVTDFSYEFVTNKQVAENDIVIHFSTRDVLSDKNIINN